MVKQDAGFSQMWLIRWYTLFVLAPWIAPLIAEDPPVNPPVNPNPDPG